MNPSILAKHVGHRTLVTADRELRCVDCDHTLTLRLVDDPVPTPTPARRGPLPPPPPREVYDRGMERARAALAIARPALAARERATDGTAETEKNHAAE